MKRFEHYNQLEGINDSIEKHALGIVLAHICQNFNIDDEKIFGFLECLGSSLDILNCYKLFALIDIIYNIPMMQLERYTEIYDDIIKWLNEEYKENTKDE